MSTFSAGVIGHPVLHSLSPVMHNAAYKYLNLDWEYSAIDLSPENVALGVQDLFAKGYKGLNVTMPHKNYAYEVSIPHGAASRLKTVNTLIMGDDHEIHGYSTDGEGFISSLILEGIELENRKVLVLGAGGASRAICDSLIHANSNVFVSARNLDQAMELVELAMSGNSNASSEKGSLDVVDYSIREDFLSEVDLIVNATPVGMTKDGKIDERTPINAQLLKSEQVVVDSIYHPAETEFLRQSKEMGCKTLNGIGMLVGQGAISFQLMTGEKAPVEVMRRAVDSNLENG